MSIGMSGYQPPPQIIETLQEYYSAILEYYDELFPVDESVVSFIRALQEEQKASFPEGRAPLIRYLGIGCATGTLENKLSGAGLDITGIDRNPEMIETAKRRMKRGFSTTRFFEMSTLDMVRFLKKGSFNIIACLNNMLPYLADETLLRKFFHDARELLAPGGKLVIHTLNYDSVPVTKPSRLPDRSSVRVTLKRGYLPDPDSAFLLDATLELGNGRKIMLQKGTKILPLTTGKVESLAREAGFSTCVLAGSFSRDPWSPDRAESIVILG